MRDHDQSKFEEKERVAQVYLFITVMWLYERRWKTLKKENTMMEVMEDYSRMLKVSL